MAPRKTHIGSLALLSLFGQLDAIEDASALIQQQKAGTLQAVSSLQEHAWRGLPPVGAGDGVRMSRLSASAEAGSSFLLNYSHFCDEFDDFGPKECALYYGMYFWQKFKVKLNGGLSSGDVLYQAFDLDLSCNESDFLSFLVPKKFSVETRCTMCDSSCGVISNTSAFFLGITVPTVVEDEAVCGSSSEPKQEEFWFTNTTAYWTKPAETLRLGGSVTATMGVHDKDNNTRISGSYVFKLVEPSMLAAKPERSALLGSNHHSFPDKLIGMIKDAMPFARAPKGSHAKVDKRSSRILMFNFTVKSLTSGSRVSITTDKGCTSMDSHGSVVCEFALGENITMSTDMDIGLTALAGSTIYTASKLHVGGSFHDLVDLLPMNESTKPLCGGTENATYHPMKCGYYRLQLSTTPAVVQMFTDFEDFNIPTIGAMAQLPEASFDDLLPIRFVSELILRGPDSLPLLAVDLAYGLKVA